MKLQRLENLEVKGYIILGLQGFRRRCVSRSQTPQQSFTLLLRIIEILIQIARIPVEDIFQELTSDNHNHLITVFYFRSHVLT